MAPGNTLLRMGSSLGGPSSESTSPTTSRSPSTRAAGLPASPPAPATGTAFDRARAFRERLNATRAKAKEQPSAPEQPRAPVPPQLASPSPTPPPAASSPSAASPVVAPAPLPAVYQTAHPSPSLVYPIGGPRAGSAPSTSPVAPTLPPPPAPSLPSPPLQPAPYPPPSVAHFSPAYTHPYAHLQPTSATPLVVPQHSPSAPPQAYPPLHWPAQPSYDAYGWSVGTQAETQGAAPGGGGGTWPAPEIGWMRSPPGAPPVPAEYTSAGAAQAARSKGGNGQGAESAMSGGVRLGGTKPAPKTESAAAHPAAPVPAVATTRALPPEQTPCSPRAHRLSMGSASAGGCGMGGFVSGFEAEFGGREGARKEALRMCGVGEGEGVAEELEGNLEEKLAAVWREKIRFFSDDNLDDAARDTLNGLHYLLLTSPSLPSLPSSEAELSQLELALLDLGIRANGLDLVAERKNVCERWRAVEAKWRVDLGTREETAEQMRGFLSQLETLQQSIDKAESRASHHMATLDTMDSDLAARMRQIAELRERAERAEAKLKEKPSQRVALLLQDLNKLTTSRDALSSELDSTRAALTRAEADLARLGPGKTPANPAMASAPGAPEAGQAQREAGQAQREAETELRRARETHDADRLIWEEKARVLRAEAEELRRKLAARGPALSEGGGGAGEGAEMARELKKAREEATKKGFVVNRLAEKVKELNKELAEKAEENAELLARLIDSSNPAASRPASTAA
ncbi:hypothetical protein JCM10450v2_007404 [Rhodotorula kratochvilovae]